MVHTFTGRGSKRYRYYTCTKAMKKGYKSCPAKSLPAAEIERVVIQQLQALGHDETLRAEILQQAQRQLDHELQDMETEQRQLDRQLARHQAEAHQLISTPGSSQANSSRIVELHVQIARVQHRLVEIKQRTEQIENRRLSDPDIDAAFDNFDELWRSLSTREQVELLRLLVARVEFAADTSSVEISFHPTAIHTLATNDRKGDAA
jgi:site-specific DNA recombinase